MEKSVSIGGPTARTPPHGEGHALDCVNSWHTLTWKIAPTGRSGACFVGPPAVVICDKGRLPVCLWLFEDLVDVEAYSWDCG
jgi:hypothetical protein